MTLSLLLHRFALLGMLAVPWAAPAAQTPAADSERIAGTVLSAADGRPLSHATVRLQDPHTSELLGTTATAADGSFRFQHLPPGRYQLLASAHGFVTSSYLEHEGFFSAIVTGQHLPTGALHLELTPAASISGKLTDETGSSPSVMSLGVPASIRLFCRDPNSIAHPVRSCGEVLAAADGSYEFSNLAPGTYFLTATAQPWYAIHTSPHADDASLPYLTTVGPEFDVAYPLVYFPGTTSEDRAEAITLKAGDSFLANMQLLPERALTIRFAGNPTSSNAGTGNAGAPLYPSLLRSVFGGYGPVFAEVNDVNGTIYMSGLPPGQYTASLQRNGAPMPQSTRSITLTDQSVTLPLEASTSTTSVSLTLRHANGSPLAKDSFIQLGTRDNLNVPGQVNSKGVALIQDMPPGDYRIYLSNDEAVLGLSVKGTPIPDGTLHLAPGTSSLAAEVTVGPTVTIQGFAALPATAPNPSAPSSTPAQSKAYSGASPGGATASSNSKQRALPGSTPLSAPAHPAVAAMVLLIPASRDPDLMLFRRDQTDLDGGFSLRSVAPGNYLLLAFDNGWSQPWTDIHWLAPYLLQAQPLHVPDTARGALTLPVALTPLHAR